MTNKKQVSFVDTVQVFEMPQDSRDDTMLEVLFYSPQEILKFQDERFEEEAQLLQQKKDAEAKERKAQKEAKKRQRRERLQARKQARQKQQQQQKKQREDKTVDNEQEQVNNTSPTRSRSNSSDDSEEWWISTSTSDSSSSSDSDTPTHSALLSDAPPPNYTTTHKSPPWRLRNRATKTHNNTHKNKNEQSLDHLLPSSDLPEPAPKQTTTTESTKELSSDSPPPLQQEVAQVSDLEAAQALLPQSSTSPSKSKQRAVMTSFFPLYDTENTVLQELQGWKLASLALLTLLILSWIWFFAMQSTMLSSMTMNDNEAIQQQASSTDVPTLSWRKQHRLLWTSAKRLFLRR